MFEQTVVTANIYRIVAC